MLSINAKGLLFVSQPRLTSRSIPGRFDSDFRFTALDKVTNAFEIANRKDLVVVLIGNLFEKPREIDSRILSRLFSLMAQAKHKPICLANAEEIKNCGDLIDDVSLNILHATQLATVITKAGVAGTLAIGEQGIDLWAAPYGDVNQDLQFERQTICIVHDVMDTPCSHIENVCQVVNGYSTGVGRAVDFNGTHWLFPESLSRLTIEEQDNQPSAWIWTPQAGIERKILDHKAIVFSTEDMPSESIAALPKSLFVELLKEDLEDELEINDGVVFKEDIEIVMKELNVSEPVRLIILGLAKRAAEKGDTKP